MDVGAQRTRVLGGFSRTIRWLSAGAPNRHCRAVKKARNNKYILLNAPNDKLQEIIRLLPGMKSPTVLPLAEPGWSSVHSVLSENDFWDIIEKLKDSGAQGILVVPIEKMVL